VDTYLADVRDRYGGVDAILLWPTYENIGCNDFDIILDTFRTYHYHCHCHCLFTTLHAPGDVPFLVAMAIGC